MDCRFPPQPRHLKLPLYPEPPLLRAAARARWPGEAERAAARLRTAVGASFDRPGSSVLLTASGSGGLSLWLSWLQSVLGRAPRVALPAFSCPELLEAVLSSGALPLFYELSPTLDVTAAAVRLALEKACDAFLWVGLFGCRPREPEALRLCQDNNLWTVLDEAQGFPHPQGLALPRGERFLGLVSFGRSKRCAGVGGGALVLGSATACSAFHAWLAMSDQNLTFSAHEPEREAMKWMRNRWMLALGRRSGALREWLIQTGLHPKRYEDLKRLLDARGARVPDRGGISPLQALVAEEAVERTLAAWRESSARWSALRALLADALGEESLYFLRGLQGPPSTLAVRVAPESRYDIAAGLAAHGVQSTWYYYPLNGIREGEEAARRATPEAFAAAGRLLVLPFQWRHTAGQLTCLTRGLAARAPS